MWLAFALTLAAAAPSPEDGRIAVSAFRTNGVAQALGEQVADLLATEMEKFDGVDVLTRGDLKGILDHAAEAQLLGCDDPSCAVDVAKLLPAGRLLTGTVGKIGDRVVVSAALIDLKQSRVTQRVTQPLGGDGDAITASLKSAALVLVGDDVRAADGASVVKGEVTSDMLEQVRRAERDKGLAVDVIGGAMMTASVIATGVDPANVGGVGRVDVSIPVASPWLRIVGCVGAGYYTGSIEQHEGFVTTTPDFSQIETSQGVYKAQFGIGDAFVGAGIAVRRPYGLVLPSAHVLVTGDALSLDVTDLTFQQGHSDTPAPAAFTQPIPFKQSLAAGVGFIAGAAVDFLVTENIGVAASLDVYGKVHGLERISEINNVVRRDPLAPLFGTTLQAGVVVQL